MVVVDGATGGVKAALSYVGTQTSNNSSLILLNNIRICRLDTKRTQNYDNEDCSAVCAERHGCLLKGGHGAR
jgi:hypothetical protein